MLTVWSGGEGARLEGCKALAWCSPLDVLRVAERWGAGPAGSTRVQAGRQIEALLRVSIQE